ncbi:reverse transcriptase domain-containing protein [Tanacetum coccineum]
MKKLIAELPILTAPMEKEELIVYLAAAREAVSAVLMTKREEKQMPVYFVSRALQDFIVERPEEDSLVTAMEVEEDSPETVDTLHGQIILRGWFDATNNEVEYEALIAGLRIAEQMGVKNLQTNVDFRLVANQVLVEELNEKSLNEAEALAVVKEEGDTWMTPIYNYLMEETLPAEKEKARTIRRKSGRGQGAIREARSKAKMEKYYNSKVHNTSFKPGDLVYRNNDVSHAKDSGKLSPKWEGSYEVTEALGNEAYKLRDCNGKLLPRNWNVRNLKKCYVHEM